MPDHGRVPATAFGMFAFVTLVDEYFAYGWRDGGADLGCDRGLRLRLARRPLDRWPRSATITVDDDLTGLGLSEASFGVLASVSRISRSGCCPRSAAN